MLVGKKEGRLKKQSEKNREAFPRCPACLGKVSVMYGKAGLVAKYERKGVAVNLLG